MTGGDWTRTEHLFHRVDMAVGQHQKTRWLTCLEGCSKMMKLQVLTHPHLDAPFQRALGKWFFKSKVLATWWVP